MVAPTGVLWPAADFRRQPALDEGRKTRSGGVRGHSDSRGIGKSASGQVPIRVQDAALL